jgi:hypothetical protein
VSAVAKIEAHPEAELLEIIRAAYERGVHVEECPMLHPTVADSDWKKCTCWYGRARKLVGPKEPRT